MSNQAVQVAVIRRVGTDPERFTEKTLDIRPFVTDVAHARIKVGRTVNIGDCNFVRLDVDVSIPCYKEEMTEAFEEARAILRREFALMVEELRLEIKKGSLR